ncbi:MAG: lysoplasmalogenase [Chloroflexota bacterium]
MNPLIAVAVAAAGVAATVNWYAIVRGDLQLERVSKAAVLAPLLAAVLLNDPDAKATSLLLGAALAASLAGDWLMLPPGRFTAGLAAFLVAHVAYLAVFLLGPLDAVLAAAGAAIGVGTLMVAGRPILLGATRAGMRRPVGAYLVGITLMAIAATASRSPMAAVGAWLFVASDARLGWRRFVTSPETRDTAPAWHRLGVMVPYHAGQILLTVAILLQPAS